MNILFCDDDIDIFEERDFLYRDLIYSLKKKGLDAANVEVARDGSQANRALENRKFDLIIMDIIMPLGENPPPILEDIIPAKTGFVILQEFLKGRYRLNKNSPLALLSGMVDKKLRDSLNEYESYHQNLVVFEKPESISIVLNKLLELKKASYQPDDNINA